MPLAAPADRQAHTGEKASAHAKEVRVDPGNDPGRDEYGLPPVDVEIPDDARDLDRDVQAYHRELRSRRRHLRVRRLTGPLTRHGMLMPLVAACLAVTLLTGTLLTVLAGRQVPLLPGRGPLSTAPQSTAPQSTAPHRTAPQSTPPGTSGSGSQLPDVPVTVGSSLVDLRTLAPAVLTWVPASCLTGCGTILRQLVRQAAAAHVVIYFVGTSLAVPQLASLARRAGLGRHGNIVEDVDNALAVYTPSGVTAIFAHASGSVGGRDVVRNLDARSNQTAGVRQFRARLHALAGSQASASGSAAPAHSAAPAQSAAPALSTAPARPAAPAQKHVPPTT